MGLTKVSVVSNKSHTLAYSIILLQELNLCYKWNPIYWSCSNLIVDSGALDEDSNDSTNYNKLGVALATVQRENVHVALPTVEDAQFGFKPDIEHDQIVFGLKAINKINTAIAQIIVANRPYASFDDFVQRLVVTKQIQNAQMIQLIKAGCFTKLHNADRRITMEYYLKTYVFEPCNALTLSQFNKMQAIGFISNDQLEIKMINFKAYVLDDSNLVNKYIDPNRKMVKRGYHDGWYTLDENSMPFFKQHFTEDSIVDVNGQNYVVSEKLFTKEVDSYIKPFLDWLKQPETLDRYNECLFKELWNKHAYGNESRWNMQALCFYDGEHELEHIDESRYGIVNYFDLPEDPEPYEWYTRYIHGEAKRIAKYKIVRIAGTIISADPTHYMINLLTKYGTVPVKLTKGHYSFYNKRITSTDAETEKRTVVENGWLTRGNMLLISGIRDGDTFYPRIYEDSIYKHTIALITEVKGDQLVLQTERTDTSHGSE